MLTKLVNGKRVACLPEEEKALRAEWNANKASQREVKTEARLLAEVGALKPNERELLVSMLLTKELRNDPAFARRHGVALDGDELLVNLR